MLHPRPGSQVSIDRERERGSTSRRRIERVCRSCMSACMLASVIAGCDKFNTPAKPPKHVHRSDTHTHTKRIVERKTVAVQMCKPSWPARAKMNDDLPHPGGP